MGLKNRFSSAMSLGFLGVISIPMDLPQWTPTKMGWFKSLPQVTQGPPRTWEVKTQGDVGGYGFLLKEPMKGKVKLRYKWSVTQHPGVTPKLPFDKDNDDYALRVGALLAGKGARIPVPSSLGDLSLTHIVFYASAREGQGGCGRSAYHDQILTCLLPTSGDLSPVEVSPLADSPTPGLELVGLWVYADSDNSKSATQATLQDVQLVTP